MAVIGFDPSTHPATTGKNGQPLANLPKSGKSEWRYSQILICRIDAVRAIEEFKGEILIEVTGSKPKC